MSEKIKKPLPAPPARGRVAFFSWLILSYWMAVIFGAIVMMVRPELQFLEVKLYLAFFTIGILLLLIHYLIQSSLKCPKCGKCVYRLRLMEVGQFFSYLPIAIDFIASNKARCIECRQEFDCAD